MKLRSFTFSIARPAVNLFAKRVGEAERIVQGKLGRIAEGAQFVAGVRVGKEINTRDREAVA